jgi:hypothetical protein
LNSLDSEQEAHNYLIDKTFVNNGNFYLSMKLEILRLPTPSPSTSPSTAPSSGPTSLPSTPSSSGYCDWGRGYKQEENTYCHANQFQ